MTAPETTSNGPTRETVGGVLGLVLGCLLVVWGFLMPFGDPAATPIADGEALLREHFEVGALPFEAQVTGAERHRDGREFVTLQPASAQAIVANQDEPEAQPVVDPEPVSEPDDAEPGDSHGQGAGGKWGDKTDWAGIPESEPAEPLEVLFAHYPAKGADAAIRRNFRNLRYKDFENVGGDGETVPVDAGEMPWGAYDVRYVHLRVFSKEDERPTFYDLLRVNLTLDRSCWILHLRWGDRVPGRLDDAQTVLEAIRPKLVPSQSAPGAN